MEDQTPTFCKDFFQKRKENTNFSNACGKVIKPKGKYSCSNLDIFSYNNHKKEK